jgi:hypothetical protein
MDHFIADKIISPYIVRKSIPLSKYSITPEELETFKTTMLSIFNVNNSKEERPYKLLDGTIKEIEDR